MVVNCLLLRLLVADTMNNFPCLLNVSNTICVRLCLTGKISPWIFEKGSPHQHLLQSEVICRSRTTELPFAKGSAALREQQIKTTSRNRETDVRNRKIGCKNSWCEQSWDRVGVLYCPHVNLYAVSAINRKSIIVLRRIGGHWQVKNENTILCHNLTHAAKYYPINNSNNIDVVYVSVLSP